MPWCREKLPSARGEPKFCHGKRNRHSAPAVSGLYDSEKALWFGEIDRVGYDQGAGAVIGVGGNCRPVGHGFSNVGLRQHAELTVSGATGDGQDEVCAVHKLRVR